MKTITARAFAMCMLLLAATYHSQAQTNIQAPAVAITANSGFTAGSPLHIDYSWPVITFTNQAGTPAEGYLGISRQSGSFLSSSATNAHDLIMSTALTSEDIILSTKKVTGDIRFKTGVGNAVSLGTNVICNSVSLTIYEDVERMTILNNGNVGIGEIAPQSALHLRHNEPNLIFEDKNDFPGQAMAVCGGPGNYLAFRWWDGATTFTEKFVFDSNGVARKPGGGTWSTISDARLKKDIHGFSDGLEVLSRINPVRFKYKDEYALSSEEFVGVIAQDMQKVAPYTVKPTMLNLPSDGGKTNKENQMEVLSFDPNALTYISINAIKELDARTKQLQASASEVDRLRAEKAALESRVDELSDQVTKLAKAMASLGADVSFVPTDPSRDASRIVFEQNDPNPADRHATIMLSIPSDVKSVELVLTGSTGKEVHRQVIAGRGGTQVTVNTATFASGTYFYGLIADGRPTPTKTMIVAH